MKWVYSPNISSLFVCFSLTHVFWVWGYSCLACAAFLRLLSSFFHFISNGVVTMQVAWLYNIRGSDVAYCPVVHAFAIVTTNSAFLYVDKQKVSVEVSLGCVSLFHQLWMCSRLFSAGLSKYSNRKMLYGLNVCPTQLMWQQVYDRFKFVFEVLVINFIKTCVASCATYVRQFFIGQTTRVG